MTARTPEPGLNAICPYFTMFPLDFPFKILREHAKSGEWVLDPFCGRGTTNYAARLLGLPSIGVDSNSVAVAIAKAKLVQVHPQAIMSEARTILSSEPREVPSGDFWRLAFHERVLPAICRLREALLEDSRSEGRIALRAIVMGALHGPCRRTGASYLSNQSPRTYAPKPAYAVNYWRKHGLVPSEVDVLDLIRARAERYYGNERAAGVGEILLADSRDAAAWADWPRSISWTVTSPPYYGMRTYNPDQWLRRWFVGGPSTVDYTSDGQLTHSSPEEFAGDLRTVWIRAAGICLPGAHLVVRFGGINDRKADARAILKQSMEASGWEILRVESAGTAAAGKRQAVHFLGKYEVPREEHDLWARLSEVD